MLVKSDLDTLIGPRQWPIDDPIRDLKEAVLADKTPEEKPKEGGLSEDLPAEEEPTTTVLD